VVVRTGPASAPRMPKTVSGTTNVQTSDLLRSQTVFGADTRIEAIFYCKSVWASILQRIFLVRGCVQFDRFSSGRYSGPESKFPSLPILECLASAS